MTFYDLGWNTYYEKLRGLGRELVQQQKLDLKTQQLSETTGDGHVIPYRAWGHSLPQWIHDGVKFPIELMQVFASTPGNLGMIHKDGIDRRGALNIPIEYCHLGWMQWFENSDFVEHLVETPYTKVRLTELELTNRGRLADLKPTVQCRVTTPILVNTDVWHRIDNRANLMNRYVLSIRFKGTPSFHDLVNAYS